MRLIDYADARRRIVAFATGSHSTTLPVDTLMMLLTQVPTIDAVSVVRCRECNYYGKNKRCVKSGLYTSEIDFCSYGKRKEGADNG